MELLSLYLLFLYRQRLQYELNQFSAQKHSLPVEEEKTKRKQLHALERESGLKLVKKQIRRKTKKKPAAATVAPYP